VKPVVELVHELELADAEAVEGVDLAGDLPLGARRLIVEASRS